MHAGIVGNNNDHACINAGVGCGEERIGCNIQADVFHTCEAACTAYGCTESNLYGNLFVGGPFGVNLGVSRNVFVDFGAGRAGICA